MARLSKRMEAVAALVSLEGVLADVGTDHAYVPIALVERGKIRRAIAMDIGEGPLSRAQANIEAEGLAEQIETRLSDGLAELAPGEAEIILIAGMGGELVLRILTEGTAVCGRAKELVLQPQSDIPKVRKFLRLHGYRIEAENLVYEDGKFYPMMRAVHENGEHTDNEHCGPLLEDLYGPVLLRERHPQLHRYLDREKVELERILEQLSGLTASEKIAGRIREVRERLLLNREAYRICSGQIGASQTA